ncbi:hypothetical protein PLICRDRAFT_38433 [Plicaturopsis crispa FD-325 SS-3]|nr:hypothetical protein PLICRDRAFT_38433 [Plicaturopsis crispa FD-325 SS-3]
MSQTLLHLVYIHGFQGNDTTFQSFPTDLQQYLADRIPPRLKVQSSLYPTYKSVKPISFATQNFIEWLSTQPPGPVILLGHSMGGLLAADAATTIGTKRVIGMVAFDTPYLGMHPHVVVSGIASLFPKDENEKPDAQGKAQPTEHELNESNVHMVDQKVTDDWELFKKNLNKNHGHSSSPSITSRSSYQTAPETRSPSSSSLHSPSPPPYSSTSPSRSAAEIPAPFVDRALSLLSSHADDPLVKWARKHADAPFAAGKRWVVEHFQFGICMFDPSGLKNRYTRLVQWDGQWVNYWTETVPRGQRVIGDGDTVRSGSGDGNGVGVGEETAVDNDIALLENGTAALHTKDDTPSERSSDLPVPSSPTHGPPTKSDAKAALKAEKSKEKAAQKAQKERDKAARKEEKAREKALKQAQKAQSKTHVARHFITLPTGLGRALGGSDKWESVLIGGVDDEVAAHCGLFIRGQNLEYEELVERVGSRVLQWCEAL